jgi:hypothetical protein
VAIMLLQVGKQEMRIDVGTVLVGNVTWATKDTKIFVHRQPAPFAVLSRHRSTFRHLAKRLAGAGSYIPSTPMKELNDFCRFGRGIYTSSTSSKSNDYSQNLGQSKCKAILLNKVVVGRGCKMMQDNPGLQAPPAGYDSVCIYLLPITSCSYHL